MKGKKFVKMMKLPLILFLTVLLGLNGVACGSSVEEDDGLGLLIILASLAAPVPPEWSSTNTLTVEYNNGNNQEIRVSWTAVTRASSYSIYRCSSVAGGCIPSTAGAPVGTSVTAQFVDTSPPANFDLIRYQVVASNSAGSADSPISSEIVAGLTELAAGGIMSQGTVYTDFLSASTGTIFQYSVPSAGTYYFFVDGTGQDADITLYTTNAGAVADNTNYFCTVGANSCIAQGVSTSSDQITLTVLNGTASYPRTIYVRVWNYSSSPSVVNFGVLASPYTGGTIVNSNYTFTNN